MQKISCGYFLCRAVCVDVYWVHLLVYVHACACVFWVHLLCVCVLGNPEVDIKYPPLLFTFCNRVSARLTGQQFPRTCLSLPHWALVLQACAATSGFREVLGI